MRKSRKWLAGILMIILGISLMTGCGKKKNSIGNTKLETGEVSENSIVAKVGDIGIKYSKIRNYCYLLKCQYNQSFSHDIWNYPINNGTIGDEAKEEIMSMVTQIAVICNAANEQDITLSSDERDEALQQAEKIVSAASEDDKKSYCLSIQSMSELFEDNILANKMLYIATDEASTVVSDEEAKQIKIQYIQRITNGVDRNGVKIALSEEEKQNVENRMKKLQKEAEKGRDFSGLAVMNTDSDQIELVIGKDSTELETEVISAAFTLQEGEVSQVITTSSGYYLIFCVEDNDTEATYARKEEIIKERQTEMFRNKYTEWLGEDEVDISKSFWKIFVI